MARFLNLIRHGAVLPSGHGLFIGSSDISLNDAGREQARNLSLILKSIDVGSCWVSPMQRARQTADLALPEQELSVAQDLREIDFGKWEQKTFEQIADENPELVKHWCELNSDFSFPDGESLPAFQGRIGQVAQQLTDATEETITIVSHGGVIRGLICHFLGLSFRQYLLFNVALGSLSTITLYDGKGVLNCLSVTPPA